MDYKVVFYNQGNQWNLGHLFCKNDWNDESIIKTMTFDVNGVQSSRLTSRIPLQVWSCQGSTITSTLKSTDISTAPGWSGHLIPTRWNMLTTPSLSKGTIQLLPSEPIYCLAILLLFFLSCLTLICGIIMLSLLELQFPQCFEGFSELAVGHILSPTYF